MYIRQHTIFSTLHPALLCLYAFGAPILAMVSNAPWALAVSLVSALAVHTFFLGRRSTVDACKIAALFVLFIALLNMLTNHRGTHIIFQWKLTPFTMESLCYGLANGIMLGTVLIWFRCFNAILSNDKFLYLFGKKLPGTALLLSMILKLFPETKYKMHCIQMAEGHAGLGEKESLKLRMKRGMRQISSLLEWSMEDSIETADSMKARAYGTAVRTSYARYVFTMSDMGMLIYSVMIMVVTLYVLLSENMKFMYYPTFTIPEGMKLVLGAGMVVYGIFLWTPIWMELLAGRRRSA